MMKEESPFESKEEASIVSVTLKNSNRRLFDFLEEQPTPLINLSSQHHSQVEGMLTGCRSVWKDIAGTRPRMAISAYATVPSQSYESTHKLPQVERAIRIKSQQRKREQLRERFMQNPHKVSQRQPFADRVLRDVGDSSSYRHSTSSGSSRKELSPKLRDRPTRDKPQSYESKPEGQTRDDFKTILDRQSQRKYDAYGLDRFVRSEGSPSMIHNVKGKESIRQVRIRIGTELLNLIRSVAKASAFHREAAFAKAEDLFETINSIEKRDARLYTAMIRLALYAKKRRKAFNLYTEMKKNGVAPDIFVYRALIEGSAVHFPSPSEGTEVLQQVDKCFQAMVEDWELATGGIEDVAQESGRTDDRVDREGTARSYAATKQAALQSFLDTPNLFATSCSHYLRFLIRRRAIDEAASFVRRGKDLGATIQGKRLIPQLPFLLSSRFLREVTQGEFPLSKELKSSLVTMFKVVTDTLINRELRAKVAERLEWLPTEWQDEAAARERERYDVDVALSYGMRALARLEIAEGETLASEALKLLYSDDHYDTYPVLSSEVSMRYGMQLCSPKDPELAMKIFERGLQYYSQVHQSVDRPFYKSQEPPDYRDISTLWTTALDIAVMKCNNLERGVSVLEQARLFKGQSMRLSPSRLPMGYILSHLMRKIADQDDWTTAIKVWQLWTDDDIKTRRSNESFYLRFITHFLMLAYRTEKKVGETQEKSKKESETDGKRPSRMAMKYLGDEVDPKEDSIWQWCRKALIKSTTSPSESNKHDTEDNKLAQKFLGAIIVTSKLALDSGPQGVDLADKANVEVWRAMLRQAGRELALGTGKQVFDHDEADWLRSGVGSKSSLALTLEDMRDLLGE